MQMNCEEKTERGEEIVFIYTSSATSDQSHSALRCKVKAPVWFRFSSGWKNERDFGNQHRCLPLDVFEALADDHQHHHHKSTFVIMSPHQHHPAHPKPSSYNHSSPSIIAFDLIIHRDKPALHGLPRSALTTTAKEKKSPHRHQDIARRTICLRPSRPGSPHEVFRRRMLEAPLRGVHV